MAQPAHEGEKAGLIFSSFAFVPGIRKSSREMLTRSGAKPATITGSAPRVWGIHGLPDDGKDLGRFSPTRVANTTPRLAPKTNTSVQPHAGGERLANDGARVAAFGSTPRVANTGKGFASSSLRSVQPHARGEHPVAPATLTNWAGSAPRVGNTLGSLAPAA